ncbi:Scavenger mRNA-decapping enzyme DcpS [Papilio machaon]|uniref:m7GpppX diphosphatase n=1 Tax=Papilio machaon TaxID=76193 RepID=A0A0N1IA92_PAPMA|nr:Scavenger mRNA-decapping enzyme DcpS [Papilio machaon]
MSDTNSENDVLGPPSLKKIKNNEQNENGVDDIQLELKDFIPVKILNNNTNRKTVCIQGTYKDKTGVALVLLEKNAFKEEDLDNKGYFSEDTKLRTFFKNDIYGNFECFPLPEINEGKSEQDRVIYDNKCEREGFVLVPDLKWDGLTKETLYLLAIVRQRGIKSLRDLNETHLPLLKRVRDEGKKTIYSKYKVSGSQLRVYLHYQPSFYHLHIHFTYLRHEAPGIYAEKSHLLDTVINNIEMMGNYYKKATLPFTIREMDTIFNVYETNGHVERIKTDK